MTSWTLGLLLSKTQELRCFQISHATKIIKELSPLRTSLGTAAIDLFHHPEKRDTVGCGANCSSPNYCKIRVQTCRAKTQPTNKWFIVSSTWSHRGRTLDGADSSLLGERLSKPGYEPLTRWKTYSAGEPRFSKFFSTDWTWWSPQRRPHRQTCCYKNHPALTSIYIGPESLVAKQSLLPYPKFGEIQAGPLLYELP
jgi:hypothetical protein